MYSLRHMYKAVNLSSQLSKDMSHGSAVILISQYYVNVYGTLLCYNLYVHKLPDEKLPSRLPGECHPSLSHI